MTYISFHGLIDDPFDQTFHGPLKHIIAYSNPCKVLSRQKTINFFPSYFDNSQIWLYWVMDDCHPQLHHKIDPKKTLVTTI
jgi:hypothetical protein